MQCQGREGAVAGTCHRCRCAGHQLNHTVWFMALFSPPPPDWSLRGLGGEGGWSHGFNPLGWKGTAVRWLAGCVPLLYAAWQGTSLVLLASSLPLLLPSLP